MVAVMGMVMWQVVVNMMVAVAAGLDASVQGTGAVTVTILQG